MNTKHLKSSFDQNKTSKFTSTQKYINTNIHTYTYFCVRGRTNIKKYNLRKFCYDTDKYTTQTIQSLQHTYNYDNNTSIRANNI